MKLWPVCVLTCLFVGCSPALDWRETRAEGAEVVAMFPCKPDHHARDVRLAGASPRMEMWVCKASGASFAVSFIDAAEPAAVGALLAELRALATGNIAGAVKASLPFAVPGMTANPQAARVVMQGRLPDGAVVQEEAAFFVKGLRVYQASVIGERLSPEMTDNFFAGLKLPS
jgi:hypothetical protein